MIATPDCVKDGQEEDDDKCVDVLNTLQVSLTVHAKVLCFQFFVLKVGDFLFGDLKCTQF
jgi:hypothetical protein